MELVFSHPQTYFDAVAPFADRLPIYTGEFQFCSPGSYAVLHRFKQHMRRAELLLERAEGLAAQFPEAAPPDAALQLEPAWKDVLFNQFHDTLAGTSIEPAYEHGRDELGRAAAAGRELMVDITRRRTVDLGPCEQQRLVLHNTGPEPFEGLVVTEPWLGAESGKIPVRYTDADGKDLIFQVIAGHAAEQKMFQYLIPVKLEPFGRTIVRMHHDHQPEQGASPFSFKDGEIDNGRVRIKLTDEGIGSVIADGAELLAPSGIRLTVQEDHTNTWGSGGNAPYFDGARKGLFQCGGAWRVLEDGPCRMVVSAEFRFEHSVLIWKVLLDKDDPASRAYRVASSRKKRATRRWRVAPARKCLPSARTHCMRWG